MGLRVTPTTNFGFSKPGVNDPVDANLWGYQLNANFDLDDTLHNRWRTTDIGSSRPSDAQAGTMWIDNSATPWVLYVYDGTQDIAMGTIDTTDGQFLPSNSGSIILVELASDYSLTLTSSGQVITGLSFNVEANKNYLVCVSVTLNPVTNWGTVGGFIQSRTSASFVAGNGFSSNAGGSTGSVTRIHPKSASASALTFLSAGINSSNNTGSIAGYAQFIVRGNGTDTTFNISAFFTSAGSISATAAAGSSITYQVIS